MTFYLTAMDLSPCAIGTWDSDLFARSADLVYYEETSIGEFLPGPAKPADEKEKK